MNLGDFIICLAGFTVSAVCVFYALAATFLLMRAWPLREPRSAIGGRLQGGCAKHDWAGRWP